MVLPSASGIHPSSAFQQCRADVCRNLELPAQVSEMHLLRLFHFFHFNSPGLLFHWCALVQPRNSRAVPASPCVRGGNSAPFVAGADIRGAPRNSSSGRKRTEEAEVGRRMADKRPGGGKQRAFRCRHGYTLATRMLAEEPRKGKKAGGCCGARLFSSAAFRAPMETGR